MGVGLQIPDPSGEELRQTEFFGRGGPPIPFVPSPLQQAATQTPLTGQPEVTIEDVGTFTPEDPDILPNQERGLLNIANRLRAAGTVGSEAGRLDIFPTIDQPLLIGNVSGRIIGNQPIFVAQGAVFPQGLVEARLNAIEKSAKERTKIKDQIFRDVIPEQTPAQFQKQIGDLAIDTLQKGLKEVGFDALTDITNPKAIKFRKDMNAISAIAADTVEFDELVDGIINDAKTKTNWVPPEVFARAQAYKAGKGNIKEWVDNPESFQKIKDGMRSYNNMITALKEFVLPNIKRDVTATIRKLTHDEMGVEIKNPDYDVLVNTIKESVSDETIKIEAGIVKKQYDLFQSEEEIALQIKKSISDEIKQTLTIGNLFNTEGRLLVNTAKEQAKSFNIVQDWADRSKSKSTIDAFSQILIGGGTVEDKIKLMDAAFTRETTFKLDKATPDLMRFKMALTGDNVERIGTQKAVDLVWFHQGTRTHLSFDDYNRLVQDKIDAANINEGSLAEDELETTLKEILTEEEFGMWKIRTPSGGQPQIVNTEMFDWTGEWQIETDEGFKIISKAELIANPRLLLQKVETMTQHFNILSPPAGIRKLPIANRIFDNNDITTNAFLDTELQRINRTGQRQKRGRITEEEGKPID